MKVILKREVDNLGLAGDVVDVADGYGRNFLLPRGMAILASRGAMKEAEAITRARKASEAKTVGEADGYKDVLEARTLRIPARVDERGHLYGSVGAVDVQRVLRERGHEIERRRIDLRGTIKEIGSYEIPVQVHPQVVATVLVDVVDEEGRVTVTGGGGVEAVVDEADVEDAATDAAEGTETDADVLAEQALEAARRYEREHAATEADEQVAEPGPEPDQGAPTEHVEESGAG